MALLALVAARLHDVMLQQPRRSVLVLHFFMYKYCLNTWRPNALMQCHAICKIAEL
jgi:hypothetical protein